MIELKCGKNSSLKVQVRSVPLIKEKKEKRKGKQKGKKEMNWLPNIIFGCSFPTSPAMQVPPQAKKKIFA